MSEETRTTKIRSSYGYSNKQLRRARRLYIWLVHREFIKNPQMVWVFSQRAKSMGFYYENAPLKDPCFSIVRGVYKIFRNYYGYRKCWSTFMKDHNCTLIWFEMGHRKKMKYGKPVIRVSAKISYEVFS